VKRALTLASIVVGLMAVCVFTSGCKSSSSSASSGGGSTRAAQTSGAKAAGGSAKATCKQLTNASVQGLMTNPVAVDNVTVVGTDSDGQQCNFDDADAEQDVDIIVVPTSDEAFGYDAAKKSAKNPVSVPGVGDEALP
jgi:hypothetical protein